MKKSLFAAVVVMGVLLAAMAPSMATIGFSQQVKLRNDPTSSAGYARTYTSFSDGQKNCSVRLPNTTTGCNPATAGGNLRIIPRTYKLVESNKSNDYYLIDMTVTTSSRHGSKGFAFLDATIKGATSVKTATYSNGKSTVKACKKYPISIQAGWGPLSAGTTVGSFTVDCASTSISRKAVSSGQSYHVTNLNAVKSVTFQRFAVVKAGTFPKFSWSVAWPTDKCRTTTTSNGGSNYKVKSCQNSKASAAGTIGTRG
jgi:hypothetical protein